MGKRVEKLTLLYESIYERPLIVFRTKILFFFILLLYISFRTKCTTLIDRAFRVSNLPLYVMRRLFMYGIKCQINLLCSLLKNATCFSQYNLTFIAIHKVKPSTGGRKSANTK